MLSYPTVLPRKRWHPIRAHTSVRPYAFFINSAQVFLDDVGANPRVRPAALSCHTDFGEENDVVLFAGDRWSPLLCLLQFFIGAAKTVRASIDAYFPKQKVDFILNDRANLFYYPLRNRIMQAITPCVPLLPKDNFLFENIGKNPVFMRLFSMFSACFLFETFNDNITARQFIIIVNSGKIHSFSVKRDNDRILLYIILLKYNIIANNLK